MSPMSYQLLHPAVKSEEYTPFGHKLNKKFLRGRPSVSEKNVRMLS